MPQITELVLGRCLKVSSVQSLSCVRLFATPCSTPGFPVHQQLPEFTQTYIHSVHDAIQPSHPLSSPSPPAFNLSQHRDLFQWVSSSHQMAKVLEFKINLNQNVRILDIQLVLREGLYIVQWEARERFSSGCSKPNCAGSCLFYLNILPVLSKPVLKLLLHAKSESEKRIFFRSYQKIICLGK